MTYLTERITIDKNICNGKPTIRGQRIMVQTILEYLSSGDTSTQILAQYPMLEEEDLHACIKFAADLMNRKFIIDPTAA